MRRGGYGASTQDPSHGSHSTADPNAGLYTDDRNTFISNQGPYRGNDYDVAQPHQGFADPDTYDSRMFPRGRGAPVTTARDRYNGANPSFARRDNSHRGVNTGRVMKSSHMPPPGYEQQPTVGGEMVLFQSTEDGMTDVQAPQTNFRSSRMKLEENGEMVKLSNPYSNYRGDPHSKSANLQGLNSKSLL